MSHAHATARPGVTTLDRPARSHTLVMPVSGRRVTMRPGETLEVQLRQLGGSGATWSVAAAPSGVVLERDEHFGAGAHTSGAWSTRLLRFRAVVGAGGVIRLVLARDHLDAAALVDLHVTVDAG
jgi:hypothetical protein